jgi:hypothetical protein
MHLVSAEHISTSGLISAAAGRELDRGELQRRGLGGSFQGANWIADQVRHVAARSPAGSVIVVDAVRIAELVSGLRMTTPGAWRILHVHLEGDDEQFAARCAASRRDKDAAWDEIMLKIINCGGDGLVTAGLPWGLPEA